MSSPTTKRTRGPNRKRPWSRTPEDGLSVLRLALDTSDPMYRGWLEAMFRDAYQVRRAIQRQARDRCRAYHAAHRQRSRDPKATRVALKLSREAFERAAYGHLNDAPHLRRFVTKALAMHIADGVWTATDRHLFPDASGRRHGMPRIGRQHDFTRLPGRARLHDTPRKWETFRLHGTLDGHRAAYTNPSTGRFVQPKHLRHGSPDGSWWDYDGPLMVVFSGLAVGTLVLPVRLPTAPSNQPILDHHLGDPDRWHKIDLVRTPDPNQVGGWRYEAHLMVLTEPYVGPTTAARRAITATATADRQAGVDVNVSNLTIASHVGGGDLKVTRAARDTKARRVDHRRKRRERWRQRGLDRSRRAANPDQYQLSARQQRHVERRLAEGRPPPTLIPRGPRKSRGDGKPLQAFRRDVLSARYRHDRAAQVAEADAATRSRRDHAREVAGALVAEHGFRITVEDCRPSTWARLWGRSVAAFSPATLLAAIERESVAVAGLAGESRTVVRASTYATALSQHCLCGQRVAKSLGDRVHRCLACGLAGDRDAVAATLAAFVRFEDPAQPASAFVDWSTARAALLDRRTHQILDDTLDVVIMGRQDAPSESTVHSARDGWSVAWLGQTPFAPRGEQVARRTVGTASRPTPDEIGLLWSQTTSERARKRTNMSGNRGGVLPQLRDTS